MSLTHQRSDITSNRSRLLRVTRAHPCPICKHPDWCSYWEDGRGAICMRVESDCSARNGQGWMHFFDADPLTARPPQQQHQPRKQHRPSALASVERRHAVYSSLLSTLTLSPAHREELMCRGLSPQEIYALGYRSAPAGPSDINVTRSLAWKHELRGVPGFYQAADGWRMVRTPHGFFVPYRNEQGLIEALQLRRFPHAGKDKYIWLSSKDRTSGASSGAPIHFAKAELLAGAEEVVITEGALKADIVAYLSHSPVIAAAGVSNVGECFAERLKTSFPHLTRAIVAFDRDLAHNAQVFRALMLLTRQLERERFQVRVRSWPPPSKGYDDYLLSQVSSGRNHG